ncbi:MerR family transcriptional regulator [Shewanella psychropiezotolerans]|uniref:HTH-type transcriptional regulator CueR n=1 Tax=Shewanella psychropiezotolerans TaxID=2593655 RepID=A0ABX5X5Z3_9GAMM|nr:MULTISPECIES: MerR family DNA-binding protein [Shewanella]MPY21304.1 MerR family transcriptional regulator [Shewanella sp. YLB-07]MPY22091.1 MerR family transcriptional regulator [Shewanella sp. YLB-07]QDO86771.1 MerR family transcriptional regulator [Shewanella psychropiezotolerans]
MKIGEVAKKTGLSVKSIRYYHDIGLICAARGENGYREYDKPQIDSLNFISHSRDLGFSLDDCRSLLDLKLNQDRDAEDVKRLAKTHLQMVSNRITKLKELESQLKHLIKDCRGGHQPDCAILSGLSE